MILQIASLVCVAALWGCTNPFIKKNSTEIVKVKADSLIMQFLLELKYLFTNVNYIIPMAMNQAGSVIYFLTLQSVDLSLSVPLANSLTFVFTAVTGCCMGETLPKLRTVLGVISILIGTSLCCLDKYYDSSKQTSVQN